MATDAVFDEVYPAMTVIRRNLAEVAARKAAADLSAWRATLQPYRRAFFAAMTRMPSPMPGHANMRRWVQAQVDGLRAVDPDHPLVGWFDDVAQPIRLHPDVAGIAAVFGLSEAAIDRLFAVAVLIERGADEAVIAGLMMQPLPNPPVPQEV